MKTVFGHHSKLTEQLKQDRIIKAAPLLLEALEESRIYLDDFFGFCDRTENQQGLMEKIDAAIKAAKGE